MANDVISATNILGNRVIQGLKHKLPFLPKIATDMKAKRAPFNASVSDFSLAAATATSYSQATGYNTAADLNQAALTCTVNEHYYTKVKLTDLEASSTNPGHLEALIARHADLASYALAKQVVDSGVAKVTIANFSNVATTVPAVAADWDYDGHNALATTMRVAGLPAPYWCLVNAYAGQGLRGDQVIQSKDYVEGTEVIATGVLPRTIAGIETMEYSGLTSPGAEKLIGFASSGDGLLFGNRLPQDAAMAIPGLTPHGVILEFTDPEGSGLSIQSRMWYDMELAEAYLVFAIQYGWAVGDATRLYRITSVA